MFFWHYSIIVLGMKNAYSFLDLLMITINDAGYLFFYSLAFSF